MDHLGEIQEQVSITVDKTEIPVSDDEADSFSSPVSEDFGYGLTKLEEGNRGYENMREYFAQGMRIDDTDVTAIHKIPWSGPNGRGRLEAFRISSAEIAKKCRGNCNVKHAWYGGSRDEICRIISDGFLRRRKHEKQNGVCLSPLEFVMDEALSSVTDEYGLRHLLLCCIILGETEEIHEGSNQCKPSSDKFDSAVDNISKPTRLIIWEAYMNSHIFPNYVISYKTPSARGLNRVRTLMCKPTSPFVTFSVLIPKLSSLLPFSKMVLINKYLSAFRAKKISRAQLIHRLRQLAGDRLLNDEIKLSTNKQVEERTGSSPSAEPK